jgi:hypothetical protein
VASEIRDRHEHVADVSKREQHRIVESELDGVQFLARESLITRVSLLGRFVDKSFDTFRNDRGTEKLKSNEREKSPVFLAVFRWQHLGRLNGFHNWRCMSLHDGESVFDVRVIVAVELVSIALISKACVPDLERSIDADEH